MVSALLWQAALTLGNTLNTTRLIRSKIVEKSNSLVYCLSALSLNQSSSFSGENILSKVARKATGIGQCLGKHSNISFMIIKASTTKLCFSPILLSWK